MSYEKSTYFISAYIKMGENTFIILKLHILCYTGCFSTLTIRKNPVAARPV